MSQNENLVSPFTVGEKFCHANLLSRDLASSDETK